MASEAAALPRRILGLSFVLVAALILAGCGGGSSASSVRLINGTYKIGDPYQVALAHSMDLCGRCPRVDLRFSYLGGKPLRCLE